MQSNTRFPVSPRPPQHLPLVGAYSGYSCPLSQFSPIGGDVAPAPTSTNFTTLNSGNRPPSAAAAVMALHARELTETFSPGALADSPFAVSAWWSIRDHARRLFSRRNVA